MKSAYQRFIVIGLVILSVIGIAGFVARRTQTANADTCELSSLEFHADVQSGQIIVSNITSASTTASVTITNNTDCDIPAIGLSSYEMFVMAHTPFWHSTQQVIGLSSSSLAPSSTVTLDVPIATCMTQVDAWYGAAPNILPDSSSYSYPTVPYVLTAIFVGSPLCVAAPTSTIPVTPTSTTSGGSGGGEGGGGSIATAEIAITKIVDTTNPNSGDTIHYTASVHALGPSESADVIATDKLPTGVTFLSATSSAGVYSSSTGMWLLGNVAAGTSATLTITAIVNAGDPIGEVITNTATVGESNTVNDPSTGNNAASATITVGGGGAGSNGGVTTNAVTVGGGGGAGNGGTVPSLPNTGPAPQAPSPPIVPRFPDTGYLPDSN